MNGPTVRRLEQRLAALLNAPPRVCVLTESFHPIVGGGETHARLLCGELNRRGAQTMVVTRRTTRQLARFEPLGGTRVYRVAPAGFKRFGKYGMLLPALLAILRRRADFDVIYVVGLRLLGVVGVVAARLLGKPCVVRAGYCGELSGSHFFDGAPGRRRLVDPLLRALLRGRRAVLLRADRFLSVSSAITSEYERWGVPASKICYIPNGVPVDRFTPVQLDTRAALRARLGLPLSGRIWAYSGKLNAGKGLESLLRTWERVAAVDPELYLLLIGAGGHQFLSRESELKAFVRERGLGDRIGFTGYVDNVNEYLQASDFFVIPSESESFCNALIEALATGIPAVATRAGGMVDIVQDGQNGRLVDVGDEQQLLDVILELSSDPAMARRLAERGRATVMERFEIGVVAQAYLDLFSSLVHGPSRPGSPATARAGEGGLLRSRSSTGS